VGRGGAQRSKAASEARIGLAQPDNAGRERRRGCHGLGQNRARGVWELADRRRVNGNESGGWSGAAEPRHGVGVGHRERTERGLGVSLFLGQRRGCREEEKAEEKFGAFGW